MTSNFNDPRRLFELYKALTGEDLAPAEKHRKPRSKEANK